MKKYIYSVVLVAVVTAVVIFFFRPLEIGDRRPPTTLALTFRFPEGYGFTEGAPFVLTWRTESPEKTLSVPVNDKNFNPLVSPYKLIFPSAAGSQAVILSARLYYCDKTSRMCFQDDFRTRVPLDPASDAPIAWDWEITPKQTRD